MTRGIDIAPAFETPIARVRGTSDRMPDDFARLDGLEALALDRFARAGYRRISTPILEPVELHERKSGAGIVAKLFELAGPASGRACLRPELTAGIVRAYVEADPAPALPWRVSHAGPAFRLEPATRADRLREFHQVGFERLGDSGPVADAEAVWLADWTVAELGVVGPTIRLGHVGLILEMLRRSGLPATAQAALIEMLSEAAAEGGDVASIGRGLDHFSSWLRQASESSEIPLAVDQADDGGIDRLFRTLVPVVNGRRSGHEIVHRLRQKWDLGHGLLATLDRVRDRVRTLAALKGPPDAVLDRLAVDYEAFAPDSVAGLRSLVRSLGDHGVDPARLELDLGFGRGIGFYSQMVFEVLAPTPGGPVEVGGGGRYDGLARVLGGAGDDRGVGFAFGLERLAGVLEAQGKRGPGPTPEALLVVPASAEALSRAAGLATILRSDGVRTILEAGWNGEGLADRAAALGASRSVLVAEGDGRGSLVLHDHRLGTAARTTREDLVRLVSKRPGEAGP